MIKTSKNKRTSQSGFTLVELLVAIAIFATFMVVSTNSLVNVFKQEQKGNILRKTQQDTRFILETVARDSREAKGELDIGGTRIAHAYNLNVNGELEIITTEGDKVKKTVYSFIAVGGSDKNTIQKTQYEKNINPPTAYVQVGTPVNLNNINDIRIVEFTIAITNPANFRIPPLLNITLKSESGKGRYFIRDEYRAHTDLVTSVSSRTY